MEKKQNVGYLTNESGDYHLDLEPITLEMVLASFNNKVEGDDQLAAFADYLVHTQRVRNYTKKEEILIAFNEWLSDGRADHVTEIDPDAFKKKIVKDFRKDLAAGRVYNRDAWARMHNTTRRTLYTWLKKYSP